MNNNKSNHKKQLELEIGKFLKEKRLKSGLTQAEVTKELGFSSAQHLSNIERGTSPASMDILKKLMTMYGVKSSQMVSFITKAYKVYLEQELTDSSNGRAS